jgi:hypothetical protein
MTEFVVLGLGADPRMYGYSPISSPEASEAAMQYILAYPEKSSDLEPLLFLLEFLFEGGLELLFGLLEHL